jgi:hypothetical protein
MMQPVSQGLTDYEPLKRAGAEHLDADEWPEGTSGGVQNDELADDTSMHEIEGEALERDVRSASKKKAKKDSASKDSAPVALKRGHLFTYFCVFIFTLLVYVRPSEIYPSFITNNIAFIVGLLTLAVYLPTQLSIEGTLTARPREVNAVLLLCVTALLSIPLAASRSVAWQGFSGTFIRCVLIFIVLVNSVRTKRRLHWLLLLAVLVSCWLSLGAINDFRLGNLSVEGYRVGGRGKGIFGNSNDLALHLVIITPIAVGLLFAARGLARKLFYGFATVLMMGAIVVTYSRSAFLGLVCAFAVLGWKLGRRNRLTVFALGFIILVGFLVLAPGNYGLRLMSIFIPSLDPVGSYGARQGELIHSLWVAVFNPVFGVGMDNYVLMSWRGLVTHNAYTQVAAELGMPAFICYMVFILTPLKRMRRVERETLERHTEKRYHYISIGLQASLVAYIVSSFFASVAFLWYVYYIVGYAVSLERIYDSEHASRASAQSVGDGTETVEEKSVACVPETSEV